MKWLCLGSLAVAMVFACTPSEIVHDYARYAQCPESQVEVANLDNTSYGSTKYRAYGCTGHGAIFYCRSDSCASPEILVTNRHAKQFGCEPSRVTVDYLDGGAWKASGCGHDLTYHCFEQEDRVLRCVAETADRDRQDLLPGVKK